MTTRTSWKLGSLSVVGLLSAALVLPVLGHANAQEEQTPPSMQGPQQGMGPMHQQGMGPMHQQGMGPMQQQMMQGIMQQMQNCMGQMAPMGEVAREEMRSQMMGHMQNCVQQIQSGDEEEGDNAED